MLFRKALSSSLFTMKYRWLLRVLAILSLALLYISLTQKYRAYDIDNPWFLSFSYNACHEHVQTDQFEQFRFPGGMDGVHLFGKIAAAVQCGFMDRFGWTPGTIVGLNVVFGIASLSLLWAFLLCAGYNERWVAGFILLLGVTEPVVSMMEKARYEFFAFFLLSLAMWLGIQGFEMAGVFIAFIAVETEPAAIMVPLVVVLLLASKAKDRKRFALEVGIIAVVALACYIQLHPGAIREMVAAPRLTHEFYLGGTLSAYFIERRRHLGELLVILIAACIYWQHRQQIFNRTPVWLAMFTCLVLFVLHPTVAYVVLAMPFLLWPSLEAYDRAKLLRWIPAALFLYLIAGYAYLYQTNMHEGFDTGDFSLVRAHIESSAQQLHISSGQLRVVGDYSLWFAHPQHYRAIASTESLQNADIYLCFDGPLERSGLSALTSMWCPQLRKLVQVHELSAFPVKGHLLHVLAPGGPPLP